MLIPALVFGLVAIASSLAIASLESGGWLRRRLPEIAVRLGLWMDRGNWQARSGARRWLVAINVSCVLALLVLFFAGGK